MTQWVNKVGKSKFVAIVLDTPSVHRSVLKAYEEEEPQIPRLYCVLHIISLLFNDVFEKLPALKDLWRVLNEASVRFRRVRFLREELHMA